MYVNSLDKSNCPEKWTGGVDWFRWKVDRLKAVRSVLERIKVLQREDAQRASTVKPWKFCGYEGFATDSIRYGQRGGYLLWESSGSKAANTLTRMEPSIGVALRIDLQLTLSLSHAQPRFGTSLMPLPIQTIRTCRSPRKLVGVSKRTDGLWLGTVGTRTSKNYLRIYDKGIESKSAPSGKMWRLEVEAKYSHARQLWLDHSTSLNHPKFCASYVVSSLTRSGSRWPFSDLASSPIDIRLGRDEATTAGKLAIWLTHTVAPTIPRLLTVYSVAEVLEMLNLSAAAVATGKGYAQPRSPKNDIARRPPVAGDLSLPD